MSNVNNRVSFWDGDNFVIVSKHCSKEQAMKILMALDAVELGITEVSPATVDPADEPEESLPNIPDVIRQEMEKTEPAFPSGKYAGMTPAQVLEQFGAAGFGNLAYIRLKIGDKDPELAEAINEALQTEFRSMFHKDDPKKWASTLSEQECNDFLTYYGGILSAQDKADIASQAGAANFESLLKDAALKIKRGIVAVAIRKYA